MSIQGKHQADIQFPPIPLVSGKVASVAGGAPSEVTAVFATIHLADGGTLSIPLEYRFGGWWAP